MEEYRPIMTTAPFTALWNASAAGRVQEVLQLLSDGANINEKCGDGGYTPLHTAVFRGQVQVVQNLLEHGADVSVKTSSGDSVLHLACSGARKTGRGAIIRSLFQKGADVHDKDKYGRTPLHRAIAYGSIQSLKLLLGHGADISIKDGEGYNALHWAAHRRGIEKAVEMIQILLAHGTDVHTKIADLSATTDAGSTPEQLAHHSAEIKGLMRSALERHRETRRCAVVAFAMGQHPRIGATSRVLALPPDVLQMIMDRV
jgi:ankyrin repeat protein